MGGGGAGSVLQVRRNLPFETQAVELVGEGAERERGAVIRRSAQAVAVQKLPDAAGDGSTIAARPSTMRSITGVRKG